MTDNFAKVLVEAQTQRRQDEPDLASTIAEFKRHLTSLTQQLRNVDEKAKAQNTQKCIHTIKVIEKTQSSFCAKLDQWVSSRYCSICQDFSPAR